MIDEIKDKLNALTEAQREAQVVLDEWRSKVRDLQAASDFNGLLAEVRTQPEAVKALFNARAKECGLTFDKKAGEYVEAAQPKAV